MEFGRDGRYLHLSPFHPQDIRYTAGTRHDAPVLITLHHKLVFLFAQLLSSLSGAIVCKAHLPSQLIRRIELLGPKSCIVSVPEDARGWAGVAPASAGAYALGLQTNDQDKRPTVLYDSHYLKFPIKAVQVYGTETRLPTDYDPPLGYRKRRGYEPDASVSGMLAKVLEELGMTIYRPRRIESPNEDCRGR